MSLTASDIWVSNPNPPVPRWGEIPQKLGSDEWPELINDRLTITSRRQIWGEVKYITVYEHSHTQFIQLQFDFDLDGRFRHLASEWRRDTKHLSTIDEMVLHPNYLKIISMGKQAVPLLLEELRLRPDHWLLALNIITDEDPAQPDDSFLEAVHAWIQWGRERGYLK